MPITVSMFGVGLLQMLDSPIDIEAGTHKLSLHTSSYSPDRDTHDFVNDVTNELATADGYTAGGVTLTTYATTYDSASDQVRFDHDNPSWTFTGSGVSWRYAVDYIDTAGASSTDPVFLLYDWGSTVSPGPGVYTLTVDAAGIAYIDTT